jgi:hypothetical protein
MNEEERKNMLEERQKWYNFVPIKFEIVKVLHHRELCFLTPKNEKIKKVVRYLICFKVDFFDMHRNWINFDKNLINVYHSTAMFKEGAIPMFSYNLTQRTSDETYKDFNENYEKYVKSYGFFIDVDGHDNEKFYEEAKELKKIFDKFSLPYYILNSSDKGFHFCIEPKYMPEMEINKLLETIYNVIYNLKGIYDFSSIDTSITDLKRVQKCPYSYVCPSGVIALPLTDEQFNSFTSEMVSVKNVLKNVRIMYRGLLVRNLKLGEQVLKENVKKFIDYYK